MGSEAKTDAAGLCLIEHAPWGVIGMVLPATHSVPTMATNAINILAAGNTAVFSPHPAGAKVAQHALQVFNREIERELGIANALTTTAEATIKTAEEIFMHPGVALLCVTGGPGVVQAAAKSGKRVIAAGPGNPPVVVDETADLDAAAKAIIAGAALRQQPAVHRREGSVRGGAPWPTRSSRPCGAPARCNSTPPPSTG